MIWLVTSDLHLSDRPRDAYRFGIFPWLARQQQKYGVTATWILGDVTQDKDKHSASLVNQFVDGLTELRPPVYILMGNHDRVNPRDPYFRFLSCIEGVQFVTTPMWLNDEHNTLLIPHQASQADFDRACGLAPTKVVFCHQTFTGAIAETGARLTGLRWPLVNVRAWAGDVHRPQTCGAVTYVGAPYHVRYGDTFIPRVLLVSNGHEQDLYYPAPRKWSLTVRDACDIERNEALREGDQVKLTIELAREEVVEWAAHKQRVLAACKGLDVFGVEMKVNSSKLREVKVGQIKTPKALFAEFCTAENVGSTIKQVGQELLDV